MAENSKIQWTHHTFNPWRGCQKISPGCANCYAESTSKRNPGTLGVWGPNGTRVVASEQQWKLPYKWNREAEAAGERRRVFCASLADVFEDWQGPLADSSGSILCRCKSDCWSSSSGGPFYRSRTAELLDQSCARCGTLARGLTLNDVRQRLFRVIDDTPWLDWLLLTKRPENISRMMPPYFPGGYIPEAGSMNQEGPRPNVWIGTSVENQEQADKRIPELLKIPAAVRFLSMEPLLGPVDFLSSDIQHAVVHQRDYYCGICDEWFDHPAGNDHCPNCGHEHDLEICPECDFDGEHEMVCPRCGVDGGNGGLSHASCCEREIEARNLIGGINWVIVGGESGPGARPCDLEWIRSIRDQCQAADVPVFVKQLGTRPREKQGECSRWPVGTGVDFNEMRGKFHVTYRLRDRKGGDPSEWPQDLRVRELPTTEGVQR